MGNCIRSYAKKRPSLVYDRVMASEMGVAAVETLLNDQSNIMVGIMNLKIVHIPFSKTIKHNKELNWHLFVVQEILAT